MNTARLKNIVIIILLLANAFLLVLLFSRCMEERSVYERSVQELLSLYESGGISLTREQIEEAAVSLPDVQPARDLAAERAFAEGVIGTVSSVDSGGGIYRYYNTDALTSGMCLIRSNGALEASVERAIDEEPADFCAALCTPFGYTSCTTLTSGEQTVVTAHRTLDGHNVYNSDLTFTFSSHTLTGVVGTFLPPLDLAESQLLPLDVVTALVRFYDYRSAAGVMCTQIRTLSVGYLLQSTTSAPLQLVPVLRLESDVYNYYVNVSTGEVLRE